MFVVKNSFLCQLLFVNLGDRNSVAVNRPRFNGKDVGSNPADTRKENGHWDGPLHRMCPNGPTVYLSWRPAI